MKKAILHFKKCVTTGCVALVYFSGHGYGDKGDTLLCLIGMGAIKPSTLLWTMEKVAKRILLLNCCRKRYSFTKSSFLKNCILRLHGNFLRRYKISHIGVSVLARICVLTKTCFLCPC